MEVQNQDSKHIEVSQVLIRKASTAENSWTMISFYSIYFLDFHQLSCALKSLQKKLNSLEVYSAVEQLEP